MGGIVGIALGFGVGLAFLALSLGFVPLEEPIPLGLRIFIFVIASIMLLVSLASVRFRIRRRIAIANGRERSGTVTLRGKLDEESGSAMLLFATAYDEWLLTASPSDLCDLEDALREGMKACVTVGENERVYALSIGGKDIPLACEGCLYQGRLRDMVEKAEKRFAEMEKRRTT